MINGVFLVALCLSIFLEAIQRFVEPQVVSNPKLVVIVGSLGLASNLLGLALFHDHGHSHGHGQGAGHSYSGKLDTLEDVEAGQRLNDDPDETENIRDESGNIEDVLPQTVLGAWRPRSLSAVRSSRTLSQPASPATSPQTVPRQHNRTSSSFGRGFGSVDQILSHPVHIRNDIILASYREERPESEQDEAVEEGADSSLPNEQSALLQNEIGSHRQHTNVEAKDASLLSPAYNEQQHDPDGSDRRSSQPVKSKGKVHGYGHSHTDLNIRGVFIHVLGDALGNIGVITSALFIWLSTYSWRYYVDPAISLVITIIILFSAIPLCKAASRILLQAVPIGLSVDEIKGEIEQLPGIISCHHLHVWQLSDTKIVASLHIKVRCEIQGTGSADYMRLARQVRHCLHGFGIHSSTVQPEFCVQGSSDNNSSNNANEEGHSFTSALTAQEGCTSSTVTSTPQSRSGVRENGNGSGGKNSKAGSVTSEPGACLLDCGEECADKNQCCPLTNSAQT